jgi:hypothetical protein
VVDIYRSTSRHTSRRAFETDTMHLTCGPLSTKQYRQSTSGYPDASENPESPYQATVARFGAFIIGRSTNSKRISRRAAPPGRVLVMVLVMVSTLLGLPQQAAAAVLPADQHQLVPAYFHPVGGSTPSNPWHVMCERMNASTAILNTNSGPGVARQPEYTEAIAFCHSKGQRVIGYVYTSYGARTLANVNADIDAYYRFYPGIDGIFLDEMSNCETCRLQAGGSVRTYYSRIYDYVKQKSLNLGTVVGNPGVAATSAWQLDTPVADVIVVFEGTQKSYASWKAPNWVKNRPPAKFSNLVYANTSGSRQATCAKSRSNNAGWIFVTDDVLPNPWDRLPTYWSSVSPLCQ